MSQASTGAPAAPHSRSLPSFEVLVSQHQAVLESVAYRMLRSRQDAEDAAQEAFLRAYVARERFDGDNVRGWLLRIVRNVALDELRRRERRPRPLDPRAGDSEQGPPPCNDPADPACGPEDQAIAAELRRRLDELVAMLPQDMRAAVVLRDVHGLSYEEVAVATASPIGTVRSRLSRGRARLHWAVRAEAGRFASTPPMRSIPRRSLTNDERSQVPAQKVEQTGSAPVNPDPFACGSRPRVALLAS